MQLEYELNKKDVITFYKKVYEKNIFLRPYVFLIAMILASALHFYQPTTISKTNKFNVTTITHASFLSDFLIYMAVFIVIIMLMRYKITRAINKAIQIDPNIIGKRKLELFDDHFIISSASEKIDYSNVALKNITTDSEYYYLYLNHNKFPSKMIPKRYLQDDSIIKKLQALLK